MHKHLQIIIILILVFFGCKSSSKEELNTPEIKNRDIAFIDTADLNAYLLYDDNYILSITMLDNHGKKIPGTAFGMYRKSGDTIFADCPNFSSEDYKNIKTKYFRIEMYSGKINNGEAFVSVDSLYQEVYYKDPVLIADSLFGTNFYGSKLLDTATTLVFVPFHKDTLLIKGRKISHIRQQK